MRAIDLQDNLSKAPLAGREQQIQQSSSELGQRHVAQELDQQHILDHSRTKASDESEGPENRLDDHDRAGGQGRRQRRRRDDRSADDDGARAPAGGKSDASRQIDLIA